MLSMNMEEDGGIFSSSSQLRVDLLTWAMSGTDDRHFFLKESDIRATDCIKKKKTGTT